jgi:hypothetical protein
MPTAMYMRWPGVSIEQYEQARDEIDWEGNLPDGAIFHVATADGDALRVFDLWESPEKFNTFVESRLMPGVRKVGIQGEPEVALCEVHRMFAPDGIEAGAGVLV